MAKCDITGCRKEMAAMHLTEPRKDGTLYQNLLTGRAYHICLECEQKLGLKEEKK